jgi:valyl-tRNA synthetase
MIAEWPGESHRPADEQAEAQMGLMIEIIRAIRNIRSEYNVEPGKRIPATIVAGEQADLLHKHAEIIISMGRLEPEQLTLAAAWPKNRPNASAR